MSSHPLEPDTASRVAPALIAWHARNGRHDLPWQRERTPYRVWVSEIMLQQTQVATVIPYYLRFMARFADVGALAAAPLDAVLHAWAGLGYYARARHLHRAAVQIHTEWGGVFPQHFADIASLPGVGRSTAAAILALSRNERHAILDGNVKRVLSRYFALEGPAAEHSAALWAHSEACTPNADVAIYTQAIMDLGATICTRRNPLCAFCPLSAHCRAHRLGRQHAIPAPRRAGARRKKHAFMLVAERTDGAVLLTQRPHAGVWGGLWCLPEFASAEAASAYLARTLAPAAGELTALDAIEHAFTHFDLTVTPLWACCSGPGAVMDAPEMLWYNRREPQPVGLPAPVKALLEHLDAKRPTVRSLAEPHS